MLFSIMKQFRGSIKYFIWIFLILISACKKDPPIGIYSNACTPSNEAKIFYLKDAKCLALQSIWKTHSPDTNSIVIPEAQVNIALNALAAIYKSTIPARDSIVNLYNIHVSLQVGMRSFFIAFDTSYSWTKELRKGNKVTGNANVDSLIKKYQLEPIVSSWSQDYYMTIESKDYLNLKPLLDLFSNIKGVKYAEINRIYTPDAIGYGSNISTTSFENYTLVKYFFGNGNTYYYWDFKVYNDCSVDCVKSYYENVLNEPFIIK